MRKSIISVVVAGCALFATSAPAAFITAEDIADDGRAGGLTFTAAGGDLALKTVAGTTGAGVAGGRFGGNEIDIGQSITATGLFRLSSTTLTFLFDGPEFGDFEEVAQLTATLAAGGTRVARAVNIYIDPTDGEVELLVDGTERNGLILGATTATGDSAAELTLGALFGDAWLTGLTFTALTSTGCGEDLTCSNQSDYSIKSITTAVPGPSSLGLLGLGLVAVSVATARRRTRPRGTDQ